MLDAWFELADPSRFLILSFEDDLRRNRRDAMKKVCRFLEIDAEYNFEAEKASRNQSPRYVSDLPSFRSRPFDRLEIIWRHFRYRRAILDISEEAKISLFEFYQDDIERLQEMVDFNPVDLWSVKDNRRVRLTGARCGR
jgi:phage gpG-like protein